MKKIFIGLFVLICVSCAEQGTYVPSENAKADFDIEFLFECDGVKIYRFYDKGRARYFATGNGRMTCSEYRAPISRSSIMVNDMVIQ